MFDSELYFRIPAAGWRMRRKDMNYEITHVSETKEILEQMKELLKEGTKIQSISKLLSSIEDLPDRLNMILDMMNWYTTYKERVQKDLRKPFFVTVEDLSKVKLPEYPIGVDEFSRCINKVIDLKKVKGISGMQINRRLKALGILSEKEENGKRCTVTNKNSKNYGIESVQAEYNGRKYEKVIFTDKGLEGVTVSF